MAVGIGLVQFAVYGKRRMMMKTKRKKRIHILNVHEVVEKCLLKI